MIFSALLAPVPDVTQLRRSVESVVSPTSANWLREAIGSFSSM